MSTMEWEPQTFRIPDNPREPDEAPVFCCWCGAVVHDDEGYCCERCHEPAHRGCTVITERWERFCLGCLKLAAKERA